MVFALRAKNTVSETDTKIVTQRGAILWRPGCSLPSDSILIKQQFALFSVQILRQNDYISFVQINYMSSINHKTD
jgi:hypothetical protein